jgi:hypothetical protein
MQVGFLAQFFFLRGHVVYLFFLKKKHKMENTLLTEINDTLFVYLNFSYHYSNLKLRKVFFSLEIHFSTYLDIKTSNKHS